MSLVEGFPKLSIGGLSLAVGPARVVCHFYDPGTCVHGRHSAAGGLVDMNARWLRLFVFVVGARAVQPSVPKNDSIRREHEPFELGDRRTCVARQLPGNALSDEA